MTDNAYRHKIKYNFEVLSDKITGRNIEIMINLDYSRISRESG